MNITINSEIDFSHFKKELSESKKVRITNFFDETSANYIADNLVNNTQWHLVHSNDKGLPVRFTPSELSQLSPTQMEKIDARLHSLATEQYQYKYKFFPIIDSIKDGSLAPDSMLFEMANFVNSTEFIKLARELTGVNSLVKMDPQATLYQSGDFLTMHDDSNYQRSQNDTSTRRFAIVFGFTKNWSTNWGGQTSFYSEPNSVEFSSWNPGYNVLTIFEVPTQHAVNFVTPFAAHGRYSITGWLRDDPSIHRPDLDG